MNDDMIWRDTKYSGKQRKRRCYGNLSKAWVVKGMTVSPSGNISVLPYKE